MMSAGRTLFYVACAMVLSACGGGGGNKGPSYTITASQSSVSLHHLAGGLPPIPFEYQVITVRFTGPTLDLRDIPEWLAVTSPTAPGQQPTSPANFDVRASLSAAPGNYSTTLRFKTSDADGSNAVFANVTVSLQVEAGTDLWIPTTGLATGGSLIARLNDTTNISIENPQQSPLLGMVAVNAPFTLSVTRQPQDQRCIFGNGETTTSGTGSPADVLITVANLYCNTTLMPWTWMGGSQTTGAQPVYGTRGTPSSSNTPGAREPGAYAADAHGNLYLFGGTLTVNRTAYRNDLWRYDIDTGTWTWLSGSNAADSPGVYGTRSVPDSDNVPGARIGAVAWVDGNGDFWLFGGNGYSAQYPGRLNDLWKYDIDTGEWTWMSGSDTAGANWGTYGTTASVNNLPGGREDASVVQDAHGDVWIFGGSGWGAPPSLIGNLNDLWRFTPATGEWTWVGGSDQPATASMYGTRGVPDAANHPNGRTNAALWADANGNLWIFGGQYWIPAESRNETYGDLWRYDTAANVWTWMSGSTEINDAPGQYSVPGTSATDMPSARHSAAAWSDAAGNLWMFGGDESNDLWKYVPATNTWSWLSGGAPNNLSPSVFGTQGVSANTNVPSGRSLPAFWRDSSGRLWLFGGDRSFRGKVSDVWRFEPQ